MQPRCINGKQTLLHLLLESSVVKLVFTMGEGRREIQGGGSCGKTRPPKISENVGCFY